ncbi:hypothetical protein TNCT_737741 [Trichonephila clavata]|uniref:Uncharacterized protein n=1 Tax=Trichonephila clavata TaxID=2740835 RepID=A0A8X6LQR2_TRICU|nr:hypothetical protein TNCT_737741 [Trichonephila clavata]
MCTFVPYVYPMDKGSSVLETNGSEMRICRMESIVLGNYMFRSCVSQTECVIKDDQWMFLGYCLGRFICPAIRRYEFNNMSFDI